MNATKTKLNTIAEVVQAAEKMREIRRGSRCACGCGGSWNDVVGGTISGEPAMWMGCNRRHGSTVGGGVTGADFDVANEVLAACDRMGIDIDDVCESDVKGYYSQGPGITGPLAVSHERELLAGVVAGWNRGDLGRIDPDEHLRKRRLAHRGIDDAEVRDGIWAGK